MSPRVIRANEIVDEREGPGQRSASLVRAGTTGLDAITLDRISLGAGAHGPLIEHRGAEVFLYVIQGSGTAGDLPLEPETMLWIEPGDRLPLTAGIQGLQVLLAEARR